MTPAPPFRDDLIARLPLPLAQLYRRAHNAKTVQERHHAAYYLWEASLKLLGSVAVVEYAELGDQDPELGDRLRNLARPAVGHWWEFVRRLTAVLAARGDRGFVPVRDLLLGRTRDDLPHAAGLDAVLVQVLEGKDAAPARATVRLTELFDRLVRYRNREFGHGAVGQKPAAVYDRVGRALLSGVPEVLGKLDALAGRRLLYVSDVRRQAGGRWLVERFDLRGEAARRLESLDLPDGPAVSRLLPDGLYLEPVVPDVSPDALPADAGPRAVSLHPLVVYDAEAAEALFLNARRGRQRADYLSYTTGREVGRADLANEQRDLLARVLRVPVDPPSVAEWAALSQAEEGTGGLPDDDALAAPRRLGEFELLSELGRGGMGVVYRAWQPSLGRQVAVKALFRSGDPKADARFAREIRALGHVEHPHVVKIFTSGSDGEQWFYAMELVEGATLAAVCDKLQVRTTRPEALDYPTWRAAVSTVCAEARQSEKPLSAAQAAAPASARLPVPDPAPAGSPVRVGRSYVRQVVELARQTADAAHALHERGVLHRDIKPGNILVTGDGAQAVLMDLGLAQIADEVEGRLTKTRQFVGTLRYASPEQVLAVGGLDRRSDVYNLGATLWELLTLRPLFQATEQTPTPELMRRIQVEEPERPRKYHRGLSRDLEAIVLKCLEKDPARRYATAADLARDLERYQTGEAVQARPVGGVQRTWRWCRRRPAIAGMLGVLAVVIVGSLVGLTGLYLNAERQKRLALQREAEAETVARFYQEHVLAAARPAGWAGGVGKDVTLKQALDEAGKKIDEAFAGQPVLEAAVRHTLGTTYYYLSEYDTAARHLEKAHALRVEHLGPDHPDSLASLHEIAMTRWKQGRLADAIKTGHEALDGRRRALGPEHADTLFSLLVLGLFYLEDERLVEAEQLLQEGVDTCRRVLGPDHHHTLHGQNDLAIVLYNNGRQKEALDLDLATWDGRRRTLGAEHPDTLRSHANVACSYWRLDELEKAEELCRQALESRRRLLGKAHTETWWSVRNLVGILRDRGKVAEAEAVYRETWETFKSLRGPDDPESLHVLTDLAKFLQSQGKMVEAEQRFREAIHLSAKGLGEKNEWTLFRKYRLAWLLHDLGRYQDAEKIYREILPDQMRVQGPEHADCLRTRNNLAFTLSTKGNYAEAEQQFRGLLDIYQGRHGLDHPNTLHALEHVASCIEYQGRWEEAERLCRQSLAAREQMNGPEHSTSLQTRQQLSRLFRAWGRPEQAANLDRQVGDVRRRVLGATNPSTLLSDYYLALDCQALGHAAAAEALLRRVLETEKRVLGPEHLSTMATQEGLGQLLRDQGRPREAETLHRQVLTVRMKVLGPDSRDTLTAGHNLALAYWELGRWDDAEARFGQVLDTERRLFGADHPDTRATQANLALLYRDRGQTDRAVKLLEEVIRLDREIIGADHLTTLGREHNLAVVLREGGRLAEAEPILRRVLSARRERIGAEHPTTLATQEDLASVLVHRGSTAEGLTLLREALAVRRKTLSPDHPDLVAGVILEGELLIRAGQPTEAEQRLRESLVHQAKRYPLDHWRVAHTRSLLGEALARQDRFAEAEPHLLAGGHGVTMHVGAPAGRAAEAHDRLIDLYTRWGKPAEADRWRGRKTALTATSIEHQ